MANFIDDIALKTGLPLTACFGQYRCVTFGNSAIYIEQHCGVTSIEPTQIVLEIKKGRIYIGGENLVIAGLNSEDIVVKGEIKEVRFEKSK